MDTSKEYIEMCKKAIEVQKLRGIKLNDDFYNNIWLPRQDQLQDMLEGNWIKKQVNFYDFIFTEGSAMCTTCFIEKAFRDGEPFYEEVIENIAKLFKSFEQAWLSFVMKKKYNKRWDGKIWKN